MTRTLVLDASAVVDVLLRRAAPEVDDAVASPDAVVPAHADAEVFSALARLARADRIEEASVPERLEALRTPPARRLPLAPDCWRSPGRCAATSPRAMRSTSRSRSRSTRRSSRPTTASRVH